MRARRFYLFLLLVFVVGFTPYFMVSIVLAIGYVARWQPFKSAFFASYLTRFIAGSLLLSACTMVVGMFCWLAHVSLHPLMVLVVYMGGYMLFRGRNLHAPLKVRFIVRDDVLSLCLSLIGVLVVLVSFYAAKPPLPSSIQIITNGFDNAAHLSMIETTYKGPGYVYGAYDDIRESIAWKTLTAYPQGWHLANALQWRGSGLPIFGTNNPTLAIHFYVATLLVWFFMAVFLLARLAAHVAQQLGVALDKPRSWLCFALAHILVQVVVFWGSLYFGFAPFLGALAYLLLLVAMLIGAHEPGERRLFLYYTISWLCAAAIGLMWLLPVPVAIAMIGLGFSALVSRDWLRTLRTRKALMVQCAVTTLAFAVPIFAMIAISRSFSVQGDSQINDDGGIFGLSSLFVLAILLVTTYVVLGAKQNRLLGNLYLMALAPQLLFVGLIYAYQMSTLGHTAYFYTKSLSLALCLIGVFFIPAFVQLLGRVAFQLQVGLYTVLAAIVMLVSLVAFTGQDTTNAKSLLRSSSKMSSQTAQAFARLIESGEITQRNVIVFTQLQYYGGDVTGNVLSTVLNRNIPPCVGDAIWLITDKRGALFPAWISACARDGHPVTVITSRETEPLIRDLQNSHIHTVQAY